MKNYLFHVLSLLFLIGCHQGENLEMITINVASSLPEIRLTVQDFMDVEYIVLETSDDFVVPNNVAAIGDDYIVMRSRGNEGTLFFFDRHSGKALWKVNHRGQGPEEYAYVTNVILDEENHEIFVNDAGSAKIMVYDLHGNYKRSFKHREGGYYMTAFNFNHDHLIVYDASQMSMDEQPRDKNYYLIISKSDGSITNEIPLPYETIKSTIVQNGEVVAAFSIDGIVPYRDDFLICEASTDTIFRYSKQHELYPFLAKQSVEGPEKVLAMGVSTSKYLFIGAYSKELLLPQMRIPYKGLVYDRQEHKLYESKVINGDFKETEDVGLNSLNVNGLTAYASISADKIAEAYVKDGLQGSLKDLAADIDEEDNPVIMLMKEK